MEPLFHLLIPILFLMAFFPKIEKKLIAMLAIFTVLPDFDLLIPNMHRIAFHNIFFVLIVVLIMFFVFGKLPGLISLFFLGSHLIMDFASNGLAFFYPIYDKLIGLNAGIIKNLSDNSWDFIFSFKTNSLSKVLEATQHNYLTTEGSLILSLVIILVIVYFLKNSSSNFTKIKTE